MEHSEPFEHEKMLTEDDHIKLQKIGKYILSSMISIFIGLIGVIVYI